jgi:hypothetical protein
VFSRPRARVDDIAVPAQQALTRRRPPAVARALRDVRPARPRPVGESAAARRALERRRLRTSPAARSRTAPSLTSEIAQTLLALVGLGVDRTRELGTWAGDRSGALRTSAEATWASVRATPFLPGLREAARLSLVEAPPWAFHAATIVMGLPVAFVAALVAARTALGPETGSALLGATVLSIAAMAFAMSAVLLALWRLAAGRDDQWPVWLIGLATAALILA